MKEAPSLYACAEKKEEKEAMVSVWETEKDVHEWKSSATQRDTKDDTASAQRQQD